MDNTFLQARIVATKNQIIAFEDAALALAGGAQSYSLNTGQTITVVTKADLKDLQDTIDGLYNRCVTLGARLSGGGSLTVRPAW